MIPFQLLGQPMDDLLFIDNIHCGSSTDWTSKLYEFPGHANLIVKVNSMGLLCKLRFNPDEMNDELEDVELFCLDQGVVITKNGIDKPPGVQAQLPVMLWSQVKSFECSCPPGRFTDLIIYERRK